MENEAIGTTTTPALMSCIECGLRWDESTERWRMLLADGETGLYCPACAAFEFGESPHTR